MSYEQHSPGPWRKCGDDRGGCKCGIVWSIPEDRAVAYVQLKDDSGECSEATFHANATLIASAPDLLRERDSARAEVKRLREALDHVVRMCHARHAYASPCDSIAEYVRGRLAPATPVPALPCHLKQDQWLRGWLFRLAGRLIEKHGEESEELDAALDGIENHIVQNYLPRYTPPPPVPALPATCASCGHTADCHHWPDTGACCAADCGCDKMYPPALPVSEEPCKPWCGTDDWPGDEGNYEANGVWLATWRDRRLSRREGFCSEACLDVGHPVRLASPTSEGGSAGMKPGPCSICDGARELLGDGGPYCRECHQSGDPWPSPEGGSR